MSRCAILLSTYNGAEFLRPFLASLEAQNFRDWVVLWRDDGSTDETVATMTAWGATQAARFRVLTEPSGNLGVTLSFMTLLRAATAFPVLAFADQDDVWLPEKLAWGIDRLAEVSAEVPALYCARQILVDRTLARTGLSPALPDNPGFPSSLTQNIATGCTVLLNAAAVRLIATSRPPAKTWHDWWCYLKVTAAGGVVCCDDRGVILYRQHGANAVGAAGAAPKRALAAARRGPAAFMSVFRANVRALRTEDKDLSPAARQALAIVADGLAGGVTAKGRALRLPGLARTSWLQTQLFRLWFLIG
ncbi:glycosyltransferase [Acidisoma cladoniae]|uniref:glycosyltransferase n=1 Tax=Acidisoma cladoniae TaxID=3040935 RepID=UPI00254C460D|nr:glycosyltransferase [Acidisoma sp. PAMC 29798]